MNNPLSKRLLSRAALRALCSFAALLICSAAAQGQTLAELELPIGETEIRSDDLIRLATSYGDAVLEYRTASLRLTTLRRIGSSVSLSGVEAQLAQVELQSAANKLQILHAIGEKLLAVAHSRAEFFRRLEREGELPAAGAAPSPMVQQAEADIRIIKMILALNPIPAATVEPPATGN